MGIGVHGRASGPSADQYRLPDLWCLHLYRYEGTFELDGNPLPIRPRYASIVPPNTKMVYRYLGRSEHSYCHFRLAPSRQNSPIRAMQDVGQRFAGLDSRLQDVALDVNAPPARRQAVVWDILWSLTSDPMKLSGRKVCHRTVERAMHLIDCGLAQPISVEELAASLGVSYGYISKLFRAETGESVVEYIRRRRADRAEHLLRYSTMSITSIAASVGVPDLQQFNRMIHRTLGCSPREVRTNPTSAVRS